MDNLHDIDSPRNCRDITARSRNRKAWRLASILAVVTIFCAPMALYPRQAEGQSKGPDAQIRIGAHQSGGAGKLKEGQVYPQYVPIEGDPDPGEITSIEPLQPTWDTAFIVPDIQMETYSDGSVAVASGSTQIEPGQATAFEIEVDFDARTYRTSYLSGGQPLAHTQAVTWLNKLVMRTVDPPGVFLAETTSYLDYTVNNSGGIVSYNWADWCRWAERSCFNTHWSNLSCSGGAAYFFGNSINNEASGKYRNTDFGNPSLATVVKHWVKIEAFPNGRKNVYYRHKRKGEFWFLLRLQLWIDQDPPEPSC